jgi:uncharacterized protein YndB with AHSA1/START domain
MEDVPLTHEPVMKTGMLIRRPVADVFEAFVNPEVTTKFWFTKSSGKLEEGKQVQWDWEMYDISVPVNVKTIEPNKRIVIRWPSYSSLTTVNGNSPPRRMAQHLSISQSLASGSGDELLKQVVDWTMAVHVGSGGSKRSLSITSIELVADRYSGDRRTLTPDFSCAAGEYRKTRQRSFF